MSFALHVVFKTRRVGLQELMKTADECFFRQLLHQKYPIVNLVVDYGNTYIKAGLFKGRIMQQKVEVTSLEELKGWIEEVQPEKAIISSVAEKPELISNSLGDEKIVILTANMPLPFRVRYATPASLGTDRLAAVAGAQLRFPHQNCLVIDVGTCITYDILNDRNEYLGGGISPGLEMKLRALHEFTAQLPLIGMQHEVELVGNSTKNSILSGVVLGSEAEMREIIRMYSDKFPDLRIMICGGGGKHFTSRLHENVIYAPDLVLEGLNSILNYNAR